MYSHIKYLLKTIKNLKGGGSCQRNRGEKTPRE